MVSWIALLWGQARLLMDQSQAPDVLELGTDRWPSGGANGQWVLHTRLLVKDTSVYLQ